MAPSTTSSSTKKIDQFFSLQRAASAVKASKTKSLKSSPSISSTKPSGTEKTVPNLSPKQINKAVSPSSTINISSSDEEDLVSNESAQRSVKRLKTKSGVAKAMGEGKKHKPATSDTSEEDEHVVSRAPRKTLEALEDSIQVKRLYNQARDRMGNAPPIHADEQTKVHHILRVFDMSYEYGPCVGMTRLQRWERANKLGLNPPAEVHEILLTEKASTDNTYKQSVFYDDV